MRQIRAPICGGILVVRTRMLGSEDGVPGGSAGRRHFVARLLGALLQNAVERRVRQVRQICIATCRRMLVARNYMLRCEDGVHGGHWADSDSVAKLSAYQKVATLFALLVEADSGLRDELV